MNTLPVGYKRTYRTPLCGCLGQHSDCGARVLVPVLTCSIVVHHPRLLKVPEILDTLRRMSDFGCENAAAIAAAPNVLASMQDMATKRCDWRPHEAYPSGLLGPSCHLFARK